MSAALASLHVALAQPPAELPPMCTGLDRPNRAGHFVARADLMRPRSLVDGDDLLALVNRTPAGALPPDYAPTDLIDLATMRPARWWECTPPRAQCLRREAAEAYARLETTMRDAGLSPYVSSAFRAYRVQCTTFLRWVGRERRGYCSASTASALPGHSQHQLGTTLDLFTREWMDGGDKFRPGYACTDGGRWIAEHAHEHGFVLPYPLHPDYRERDRPCAALRGAEERIDPRTGYRFEPWHLRYVGVENAARFHEAWRASGPGTASEITLEQWLRAERGLAQPIGAAVCDGCNCDRCATFETGEHAPCRTPALVLDADGTSRPAAAPPSIVDATLERAADGALILHATVTVPQNTETQPPVVTEASGARFRRGERHARLPDRDPRAFAPIAGAWRLAIGFDDRDDWPWLLALAGARRDGTANGLNARFPAPPGELRVMVPLDGVLPATSVRVALTSADRVVDARTLIAP